MKTVLIAAVLATVAATPSLAAKAKTKSPPPPPPTPISSWSGCYVGANGGYGWNNGNSHYSSLGNTVSSVHGSIIRFGINYRFN
jgi:outer membrane immunogenic protein